MRADSCHRAQPFLRDGARRSWVIAISSGHPVDMGWVSVVGGVVNRAAGPRAPQAIAIEFDAVGVVDEAVEMALAYMASAMP